jgi:hypothetical protein
MIYAGKSCTISTQAKVVHFICLISNSYNGYHIARGSRGNTLLFWFLALDPRLRGDDNVRGV